MLTKTLKQAVVIALLFSSSATAKKKQSEEIHTGLLEDTGTFNIKNPGMGLRLTPETIFAFRNSMASFLPHFLNYDIVTPTKLEYTFSDYMKYWTWNFNFHDIVFDHAEFNIYDTQIRFLTDIPDLPRLELDVPILKHWKMDAVMDSNSYWIPNGSKMTILFENFDVGADFGLALDPSNGFLKPTIYKAWLHWGDSDFYHDNWFIQACLHQFVEFALVMIENSSYFIGDILYTRFGEPVMTSFLNNYKLPLPNVPSPFFGQPAKANFNLDFRNTMDPIIYPDSRGIDFKFNGELEFRDHECNLEHEDFKFLQVELTQTSQIVVTDSVFSCNLNAAAKSDIGKFDFNEQSLNTFFGVDYLKFDTTSFAKHMPIFKTKLGAGKPLKMFVNFKDFKVQFAKNGVDLTFDYSMCVQFFIDKPRTKEYFADCIHMVTKANLKTKNDRLFIDLKDHKLEVDAHYQNKKLPDRNNMKMRTNEYREFLATFESTNQWMFNWMKNHIKEGITFPYHPSEILTNIHFQEGSMHVMLDVNQNAQSFLEDKLWSDVKNIKRPDEHN